MTIYTIGHSTRTIDEFINILQTFAIYQLVDIRTVPRSRHNPQFNRDTLPHSLAGSSIDYRYLEQLGGLRKTSSQSPNTGWRNLSFRGYADYMQTPEFAQGLVELIKLSQNQVTVIMCAEAVPWRCHRSLVGDALLVRGIEVIDIFNATKSEQEKITSFAKVAGTSISYPPSV